MKKLQVLVVLFSIGMFVSCSTTEVDDEIGLELSIEEVEEQSGNTIRSWPFPPPPSPCYNCF